ncbi:MAG: hypothetical protein EXX96DRAFT_513009 [Benjaminiella poitrasii]|nr:MAG: hypothetical protein EXX96DRAFT_513009 [Benjaminiella poitrasii]
MSFIEEKNDTIIPHLGTCPTRILTIQDVLLDTPVWRTNKIRLEDQLDSFEKWTDGFIPALKNYIDIIQKFNALAATLSKRTVFQGFLDRDYTLMDSKVTCDVVNTFASALESAISEKSKMASDLEDRLLKPLQDIVKSQIKQYKDARKQFERQFDKFESQQTKFYNLNKDNKEPSALREDAFQLYDAQKTYTQTCLDYFLILVNVKHQIEEFFVEGFSSTSLSSSSSEMFVSTTWITGRKATTIHDYENMRQRGTELLDLYLANQKPDRSLDAYRNITIPSTPQNNNLLSMEGYLNYRLSTSSSTSWRQRWCFVNQGYFASLVVNNRKKRGCILLGSLVFPVREVDVVEERVDHRRHSFQLVHTVSNTTLYLQAQKRDELIQWLSVLGNKEQQQQEEEEQQQKQQVPQFVLLPKQTLNYNRTTTTSIVTMSTSSSNLAVKHTLTTVSSLMFLLIQRYKAQQQDARLYPSGTSSTATTTTSTSISNTMNDSTSAVTALDNSHLLLWPFPNPHPLPTHDHLLERQIELSSVFSLPFDDEIVLETSLATYYPTYGTFYITQYHVWFYSCSFMSLINVLVIPIKSIDSVSLDDNDTMTLHTTNDDTIFRFGLFSIHADLVVERLRLIMSSMDSTKELQEIYDEVTSKKLVKKKKSMSLPTQQVTSTTSLFASVTPLTVQAQQPVIEPTVASSDEVSIKEKSIAIDRRSSSTPPVGSPAQTCLAAVVAKSQSQPPQEQQATLPPTTTDSTTKTNNTIPKTVNCNCPSHLEKTEADVTFDTTSAQDIFNLLFDSSEVWTRLNAFKGFGEPNWIPPQLRYMMPISNPMVKAKQVEVIETIEVARREAPDVFVVRVTTETPGLPYADSFRPVIQYCVMTNGVGCRLKCSVGVEWVKSVSFFVKGMVHRAAMKGMQDTVQGLLPILRELTQSKQDTAMSEQQQLQEQKKQQQEQDATKETVGIDADSTMLMTGRYRSFMVLLQMVFVLIVIGLASWTSWRYRSLEMCSWTTSPSNNSTMVWRGVYLRDLQEDDSDNDSDSVSVGRQQEDWVTKEHAWVAAELSYAKQRLGAIRYELLSAWKIMNGVERELLEAERENWLTDQRQASSLPPKT